MNSFTQAPFYKDIQQCKQMRLQESKPNSIGMRMGNMKTERGRPLSWMDKLRSDPQLGRKAPKIDRQPQIQLIRKTLNTIMGVGKQTS